MFNLVFFERFWWLAMKKEKINKDVALDYEVKTYMLEGMSAGICAGASLGVIIGVFWIIFLFVYALELVLVYASV